MKSSGENYALLFVQVLLQTQDGTHSLMGRGAPVHGMAGYLA